MAPHQRQLQSTEVLYDVEERIELWGLQIPHNSVRPPLEESTEGAAAAEDGQAAKDSGSVITWTSVDRLNMSIGLLYALCNHALDSGIKCGFCVPRPQLLKRWLQAGVKMRQIPTDTLKLIYPPSAHDYEYYKASTVAYFMITEVREALEKVLGMLSEVTHIRTSLVHGQHDFQLAVCPISPSPAPPSPPSLKQRQIREAE
ncbi:kinesin-like protein, partial [Haematococcus lacustris]